MSQLQISKPNDPLAGLRIDRTDQHRSRPRWAGKLWLVLFLAALVAAGGLGWAQFGDQLFRPEVRVANVEGRVPGVADAVLAAQGYLKSRRQAAIGAKVAGQVSKICVEEGDSVEEGTVLAELEHKDMDALLDAMTAALDAMDASLEAMVASLTKSKAELSEVESTLALDERDFDRAEQLLRNKGISAAEHERAQSKVKATRDRRESLRAAVTLAEARLREARARKAEAEARIRETDEQRKNYLVIAPFAGTVISKEAEVGESIMPGGMGAASGSGRGSVVTLAKLLDLEVETDVKEDYVSRVKKDQRVSVAVDGVPDRRFTGRVRAIIPMGDRARGTVKVKVHLDEAEVKEVNDPFARRFTLFPEMAATVHFMSEGKEPAGGQVETQVYAPAEAIQKDESGVFVWQVVGEKVKRVTVEVGDSRDNRVLIQRGLKGGEQVVVRPPANSKEDMFVKIVQ